MSTTLASAIYTGHIRHRRYTPKHHAFTMPIWMLYLDLSELGEVFSASRWWSCREFAPVRYHRSDYLGDPSRGLDTCVRDEAEQQLGFRPSGPVRMLTHLRQFGYVFNPVTFYYCFDPHGERLEAVVAQITNTPWNERHAYALDARDTGESPRFGFTKAFHVSPFQPMGLGYDWVFSTPNHDEGSTLGVMMNLTDTPTAGTSTRVFDALLRLNRVEITEQSVRSTIARYPLLTARVTARIHLEALKLWIKRVPISPHPKSSNAAIKTEAAA